MKPETLELKRLLAGLGIPRGDSVVSGRPSGQEGGAPTAVMTTDTARRTAVEHAGEIVAAGYTVILNVYRCGCPALVWLCGSSTPDLRRTVRAWTHKCPTGAQWEPVTPVTWLDDLTGDIGQRREAEQ